MAHRITPEGEAVPMDIGTRLLSTPEGAHCVALVVAPRGTLDDYTAALSNGASTEVLRELVHDLGGELYLMVLPEAHHVGYSLMQRRAEAGRPRVPRKLDS